MPDPTQIPQPDDEKRRQLLASQILSAPTNANRIPNLNGIPDAPMPTQAGPQGGPPPIGYNPARPLETPTPGANLTPPKETTWQRIEHGLSRAANIAGDVLAPATTSLIPGSDLYKEREQGRSARLAASGARTGLEQEQTAASQAGRQLVPWTPTGANESIDVPQNSVPKLAAAQETGQSREDVANTKNAPQLAKLGLKQDASGNIVPMEDNELSPELRQTQAFQKAATDLKEAQTKLAQSKNDPNSAAYKLELARVEEAKERTQQAAQALGLHQQELVKPSGQSQSRGSAAQAVMDIIPGLEKMVRDNGANMGPIMGRLARGEI